MSFVFKKNTVFICMSICLNVCTPHACSTLESQKRESDSLKLGIQWLWASTWVLRIKPGSSRRTASPLNCWRFCCKAWGFVFWESGKVSWHHLPEAPATRASAPWWTECFNCEPKTNPFSFKLFLLLCFITATGEQKKRCPQPECQPVQ